MKSSIPGRSLECIERLNTLALEEDSEQLVVVEVGVLQCKTGGAIMREVPTLARIYLVDPWQEADKTGTWYNTGDATARMMNWRQIFRTVIAQLTDPNQRYYGLFRVLNLESEKAARAVDDGECDLIFIDADHSREAIDIDLNAWWPKIRIGGWFGGHDFDHPQHKHWGVTEGVRAFASKHNLIVEHGKDMTWWIRKL